MKIGLISDTHMPHRWKNLPERVFFIFADVDLILHAGDVGELWVLDELSHLAPVVAVHGNDETEAATAALPYLQTVMIEGHRLVLTHAHYPDRAQELASRVNPWDGHFERRANFAKEHGAKICIFGHTHIPMNLNHDGVLLINSGAIASGNPWTMQLIQTVAILELEKNEQPILRHYDLATGEIHLPYFNPQGFAETATVYGASIYEESLLSHCDWLWRTLGAINPQVHEAILRVSFEVWDGRKEIVLVDDLAKAMIELNDKSIRQELKGNPIFAPYIS